MERYKLRQLLAHSITSKDEQTQHIGTTRKLTEKAFHTSLGAVKLVKIHPGLTSTSARADSGQ
jgi:hypothetical protein